MEVTYHVSYHPLVVTEDIPRLDASWRRRIKFAIEQKLATRPDIFGLPLRRSLKGHRKLRVGDYRIVFRVQGSAILILAIQHRSKIYTNVIDRI